jgi:hypothetical protein
MAVRLASIIFKALLALGCLTGLVLNLVQSSNPASLISYYTIQSNLVCLVLFIILLILEIRSLPAPAPEAWRNSPWLSLLKGGCTVYILLTFLVYNFVLAPGIAELSTSYQLYSLQDLLVHYFSPLMVLLDYFLFDRKGRFKAVYPLGWTLLPLAYLLYVFVFASLGGRFYYGGIASKYPYFFLNIEKLGLAGVGKWILFIAAAYLLLSYVLTGIDFVLGKLADRKETPEG